jgi:putative DNA primase/helicase
VNVRRGIWHCFAGCGAGGIIAFEQRKNGGDWKQAAGRVSKIIGRSVNGVAREIARVYPWTDEDGELLYEHIRYVPKCFRWRRPNGNGGYTWSLGKVRRVLWNLPGIVKAGRVFLVEGERDGETLESLGLTATTSGDAPNSWRDEFAEYLRNKDVIALPDNDAPGRELMDRAARSLYRVARSLKVVELPLLPEHGDVSDFCTKVGSNAKDLLLALVEDAPPWSPARAVSEISVGAAGTKGPEHLTDLGNARRIVNLHGQDMRYCAAAGGWLMWTGKCWETDKTGEAVRRAKAALQAIYREAESTHNRTEQHDILRWAKQSESQGKIQAALALAQSERELVVMADERDKDPWLLNCQNGTLDLRTGDLRAHSRQDFMTRMAAAPYDVHAECQLWESFLDRVLAGDPDLKAYLQTAVGYSLSGSTREQCLFVLYGTGNNGKTSFLETIRRVLGTYAINADFSTFALRERSGASGDLARLAGARLVTSVEPEKGERLSLSRIKQVTGGDRVTARHLFQSEFEFTPQFKLWLAVNDRPRVGSAGPAMWRRIKAVPFTVLIPESEIRKDLCEKLQADYCGILRWAIQGCLRWREPGLKAPPVILEATELYREECDVLADFIADRCEIDLKAMTPIAELYRAYRHWCETNRERPRAKNTFSALLTETGFVDIREGKERTRMRQGLKLRGTQETVSHP